MIGPLTSAALWLAGFWLEIFLWSLLCAVLYTTLFKYLVIRYVILYPGIVCVFSLAGWIISFCIWLAYSLIALFYDWFIADVRIETDYASRLGLFITLSTILTVFIALRFIYKKESEYWESKRQQKQKKT